MKYLIVFGDPIDGFNFRGPFDDHETAHFYADIVCEGDWWLAELTPPDRNNTSRTTCAVWLNPMRTIRTIKRADDMPLFGKVTRVRKGLYEVVIKFVKSHRTLHVEQIGAPDVSAAKALFMREFPTLVWGKPKPALSRSASMPLSPVQRRFCESVRNQYVARYASPLSLSNEYIFKLALSYKFIHADDKEVHILLDDLHGTNSGADLARLDDHLRDLHTFNPKGKP